MEREVLINLYPKTDYERLLFAERYIKELKESLRLERLEKGKLQSEVQEYKFKLNLKTPPEIKGLNREAQKELIKDSLYKKQIEALKILQGKNRRLMMDNETLIIKLNTK